MTEVEKFLKLKGERDTLQSRLNSIPAEVSNLSAELGPLQDAAVRAEIEGDKHAPDKRQEIDKSTGRLEALEAEKKKITHRSKVMGEIIVEQRSKAVAELAGIHDKQFRAAVKTFGEALKKAQKAEATLVKVFMDAQVAFSKIDSQSPLPGWEPMFVRGVQDPDMNQKVLGFLDRWVAQGFDVSKQ